MSIESFMSEQAVAKLLGVAAPTLRRWRWAGKGPAYVKVGSAVRYRPAALDAYIERGTVTPALPFYNSSTQGE